jgi:Ser/Thr protein kinase RdoA (MazF antagonist)
VAGGVRAVRTPALEGHLPARLVTVQPVLSGSRPSRAAAVAMEAGRLLGELHAASPHASHAGVPEASPSFQLAAAERSSELVTALLPGLYGRVQALLGELEATMPVADRLVHSHGDFNARQLLVTSDGVAAVDFDSICLAPPALDVADYAGHEVRGTEDDVEQISRLLVDLVEGYGERPVGLSWYLATSIVRRSPEPFRYVEEHWPERIEGMIAASEAALRL